MYAALEHYHILLFIIVCRKTPLDRLKFRGTEKRIDMKFLVRLFFPIDVSISWGIRKKKQIIQNL